MSKNPEIFSIGSSLSRSISGLFLSASQLERFGILAFASFVSYHMAFAGCFMDWDMRHFATMVQTSGQGDATFTFVHNLLCTWILVTARLLKVFIQRFDAFLAVKFLTVVFASLTAYLLFLTVKALTQNRVLVISAALMLFIIPGNIFLITSLEDNVWANFFNALYIYQVLVLTGHVRRNHPIIHPGYLYCLFTGTCLSIGINLHQQVALLLYGFPVALLASRAYSPLKAAALSAVCLTGYICGSVVQNLAVFSKAYIHDTILRLWSNPYRSLFPQHWFFSSGYSVSEWTHRIVEGWEQTFGCDLLSGTCLLSFAAMAVTGLFVLVRSQQSGTTGRQGQRAAVLAVLSSLVVIHVPYSLLYEPWKAERWDATLPGLIVLCMYLSSCLEAVPDNKMIPGVQRIQIPSMLCSVMAAWVLNKIYWLR